MAMASGIGAKVSTVAGRDPIPVFFGEDQGRYVVTVKPEHSELVAERARVAGVSAPVIGMTGGTEVVLGSAKPLAIVQMRSAHESWFPDFMEGSLPESN
jgi:phosphoribosylformylglycinamidine (FGAM) synthase-like enzyme